jgi:hypothetical protein
MVDIRRALGIHTNYVSVLERRSGWVLQRETSRCVWRKCGQRRQAEFQHILSSVSSACGSYGRTSAKPGNGMMITVATVVSRRQTLQYGKHLVATLDHSNAIAEAAYRDVMD